jgi:hypothetical protein
MLSAQKPPSSLLRPYIGLARLFASTPTWQELTNANDEEAALPTVSYPDYRVLDEGSCVRVPLIVVSNPLDLSQMIFKPDDAQGRRGFGQLLCSFVMLVDEEIADRRLALLQFIDQIGTVTDEALDIAADLRPDGASYFLNLSSFALAIAAGECALKKLSGIPRDDDSENPNPRVVHTMSLIADWI